MVNKKTDNGKIQIWIISFLIIIFLSLIFFSTSKSGVEINYSFEDEIIVKNIGNNDFSIKIGELNIKNKGFLTKRVKLNKYALCLFLNNSRNDNFDIYYSGTEITNIKGDIFNIGRLSNIKNVDINSDDVEQLNINANKYAYEFKQYIKSNNLYNTSISAYLFEITNDNSQSFYYSYKNYCDEFNREEALKVINLKLELSRDDFTDIKDLVIR